jgi:hypothetical protein
MVEMPRFAAFAVCISRMFSGRRRSAQETRPSPPKKER